MRMRVEHNRDAGQNTRRRVHASVIPAKANAKQMQKQKQHRSSDCRDPGLQRPPVRSMLDPNCPERLGIVLVLQTNTFAEGISGWLSVQR